MAGTKCGRGDTDAESVTRRGTEVDKKGRRDESREPSWQTLAQQLLVPPCLSSLASYSLPPSIDFIFFFKLLVYFSRMLKPILPFSQKIQHN
jgi:hypothetical protein